jgi:hypothetical protein
MYCMAQAKASRLEILDPAAWLRPERKVPLAVLMLYGPVPPCTCPSLLFLVAGKPPVKSLPAEASTRTEGIACVRQLDYYSISLDMSIEAQQGVVSRTSSESPPQVCRTSSDTFQVAIRFQGHCTAVSTAIFFEADSNQTVVPPDPSDHKQQTGRVAA